MFACQTRTPNNFSVVRQSATGGQKIRFFINDTTAISDWIFIPNGEAGPEGAQGETGSPGPEGEAGAPAPTYGVAILNRLDDSTFTIQYVDYEAPEDTLWYIDVDDDALVSIGWEHNGKTVTGEDTQLKEFEINLNYDYYCSIPGDSFVIAIDPEKIRPGVYTVRIRAWDMNSQPSTWALSTDTAVVKKGPFVIRKYGWTLPKK